MSTGMRPRLVSTNRHELADEHKQQQKSKYDPADFLIPAKDAKGESTRIYCRVQPAHDRQVDALFYSRRWPFKTPSDIIRWCIHTGLKRLEAMEDVPSVTQQVEAMNVLLRDQEFNLEFQHFLQQSHTLVQRHITEGAHAEARRLVSELRRRIDAMPDGHWKRKYQATLKANFAHLLSAKKAPTPALGAFNDHTDDDELDDDLR